ncbi:hypothetical protein HK405_003928 [Cladochytrium tenue]|nr:hypothetical protein HK405_003928 [Cladochytrium tenue]
MTTLSTFKLEYFPIRGRGDLVRLVLVASGVTWEDVVYDRKTEWPAIKPSMPFGQLPVLTEYDASGNEVLRIAQSMAIERYLSRRLGLAGSTLQDSARLDAICESLYELRDSWWRRTIFLEDDSLRDKMVTNFFERILPTSLAFHERLVGLHGKDGHYYGSELTFADIATCCVLENIMEMEPEACEAALSNAPGLRRVVETVKTHPRLGPFLTSPARYM